MAKPLNERLTKALTNAAARSAELEALIGEATAERERLSGIMAQANDDALNLGLSDEDRDAAGARADRARRDILAMSKVVANLETILAARVASEQKQAVAGRRGELLAERDRIAAALRAEWPDIEARIVSLLSAVTSNASAMKAAGIYEADAEAVARDLPGNFTKGSLLFRQLSKIALPSFANGHELAWPAPERPAKHWTEQVAEGRKRQVEAQRRQDRAEAEAWAGYSVSAGAIKQMTEVKGRDPKSGVETGFTLYPEDIIGAFRTDNSARTIRLHANAAERLRRLGASIEPVS
ncbi:hypothetical protein [Novosphingobium sp. EMRT-2]|uniref:hypothetical protein n=1 Tax=Novosphingobium sp. EMRT-2 TaxID=2571749 RepID=UPI0010BE19CD|nr:hypothetical protein [Novosphingobium sp. EMRT-2]QCI92124.1 hypothetical protein FA702_00090 [Novosphingobium sp. EMRT-2]QCI95162.1 hypothetical protein FA702_17715 [Novosphingobium sp. EMRT-2]